MSKCLSCRRDVPSDLLSDLVTNEGTLKDMCPVCALHLMSVVHEERLTSFKGIEAQKMLVKARAHYEETKQRHMFDL